MREDTTRVKIMITESSAVPWYGMPTSDTGVTCEVHLLQAGSLDLPNDLVLLPAPNTPNSSLAEHATTRMRETFTVPDYVFLITHTSSGHKYLFDLGMRKDIENSTPAVSANVKASFECRPENPADILKESGTADQQPSNIRAIIFSHLHFDHIGDFGKKDFKHAEFWIGPSACTTARPGFPIDQDGSVFSDDLPSDGTRHIREWKLPTEMIDQKRAAAVNKAEKDGNYRGIDWFSPAGGWFRLGAFDSAFDLFGDGSAYVIDAPGHASGHQMLLLRVQAAKSGKNEKDSFILLAGDCFHHPKMLSNPLLTARPPFSKGSMHLDSDVAINTIFRAKRMAEEDNVWVIAAHDYSVGHSISPGSDAIDGLVSLNDWHENRWKQT